MAENTKYIDREISKISLHDFDSRIDEVTSQLIKAAEDVGFFSIIDHGIPLAEINRMFDTSEAFFALPDAVKATVPWNPRNVGWERNSQVHPCTGKPDTKESYQLQFGENMEGMWIGDEHVPGFRETSLAFMHRVQAVSEKLMLCFARGLGIPDDYFIGYHDVTRPNSQTTMRLQHYFALSRENKNGEVYYRAGAHCDWGFLTLLFQREGQSGLEIFPGREVVTEFALGDAWTKVDPKAGEIVCDIGDLLMPWSVQVYLSSRQDADGAG